MPGVDGLLLAGSLIDQHNGINLLDPDLTHWLTLVDCRARMVAGAGNCPLQQSSDILDLFLLPSGKALPAEV